MAETVQKSPSTPPRDDSAHRAVITASVVGAIATVSAAAIGVAFGKSESADATPRLVEESAKALARSEEENAQLNRRLVALASEAESARTVKQELLTVRNELDQSRSKLAIAVQQQKELEAALAREKLASSTSSQRAAREEKLRQDIRAAEEQRERLQQENSRLAAERTFISFAIRPVQSQEDCRKVATSVSTQMGMSAESSTGRDGFMFRHGRYASFISCAYNNAAMIATAGPDNDRAVSANSSLFSLFP